MRQACPSKQIEDYLKDGVEDDQKVYRQYKDMKDMPGYSDPK